MDNIDCDSNHCCRSNLTFVRINGGFIMKINKIKDKRGAISWSVIITLIVIVLVGAIILIWLGKFPFQKTIDKESCHQSVVLRSNSLLGISPGKAVVPLKCKTEEIIIDTRDEQEIKEIIANEMYDCWWMLGEGKLNFFDPDLFAEYNVIGAGKVESSCVICSTIKFSDDTKEAIKEVDIFEYLVNTKVPGKDLTYFEYFTDQADADMTVGIEAPLIDTEKDYLINFMGVKGQSYWETLKNDALLVAGAAGGAGFMALAVPGGKAVLGKLFGLVTTPAGAIITGIVAVTLVGTQIYQTAENNAIVSGRCNGEWQGCYNMMLAPLSASEISSICSNIESIP